MTTTTKGQTMPEAPATPASGPESAASPVSAPTVPGTGAGAHTFAAYVVRVTADNVRMDRVRCDECEHYTPPDEYDTTISWSDAAANDITETPDKHGRCAPGASAHGQPIAPDSPMYAHDYERYRAALRVRPDHACNAWTPKAGQ
jgi:hypothetical protein